jgi:hypothetical protein
VLRVSVEEVLLPTLSPRGPARQEVQDSVAEGGVQSQSPKLGEDYVDELSYSL